MSKELLDIVDYADQPTGKTTTKKQAHDKGILHRIAAVLVFTPSGKLLVQRHKEWNRQMDHAVGGHVISGESYREAAEREMLEELGLMAELEEIGVVIYSPVHYENYDLHVRHSYGIFKATVPPGWVFEPNDEVDDVVEMELEEVIDLMNREPDKFLNGFFTTITAYLATISSDKKVMAYGKDWSES